MHYLFNEYGRTLDTNSQNNTLNLSPFHGFSISKWKVEMDGDASKFISFPEMSSDTPVVRKNIVVVNYDTLAENSPEGEWLRFSVTYQMKSANTTWQPVVRKFYFISVTEGTVKVENKKGKLVWPKSDIGFTPVAPFVGEKIIVKEPG